MQVVLNWIARNASAYWSGLGIAVGLWLIVTWVLLRIWQQEQDGELVFGEPTREKLLVGVPVVCFLVAALLGLRPLLVRGGFAAVGGALIFLVLAFIALIVGLGILFWMLRLRLIRLDTKNQTWQIQRGFVFALRIQEGNFDEIRQLELQEVRTWSKIVRRIVVVWNLDKTPCVLCEGRYKRPGISGKILLITSGLGGVAEKANEAGWEAWKDRLEAYGSQTGLPIAIED